MSATDITTILDVGTTVRYTQPINRLKADGVVVGIIRHQGTPWLEVSRVRDQAHVVVGLHEVVRVLVDTPVREETPVIEVPVLAHPVGRVAMGARVRFLSVAGHTYDAWVQEMDGDMVLVEREDTTLERITLDDLCALSA